MIQCICPCTNYIPLVKVGNKEMRSMREYSLLRIDQDLSANSTEKARHARHDRFEAPTFLSIQEQFSHSSRRNRSRYPNGDEIPQTLRRRSIHSNRVRCLGTLTWRPHVMEHSCRRAENQSCYHIRRMSQYARFDGRSTGRQRCR